MPQLNRPPVKVFDRSLETDIREYVTRRKISGATRSELALPYRHVRKKVPSVAYAYTLVHRCMTTMVLEFALIE